MLSNVLLILLGAGLVSVGFLTAALAERIRSTPEPREPPPLRNSHEPRETAPRPQMNRAQRETLIPVIGGAELLRPTAAPRPARAPRTEPKVATSEGGDDVVAALMAAGYNKPIAAEATWACSVTERATIEGWTASALRRCARGGVS